MSQERMPDTKYVAFIKLFGDHNPNLWKQDDFAAYQKYLVEAFVMVQDYGEINLSGTDSECVSVFHFLKNTFPNKSDVISYDNSESAGILATVQAAFTEAQRLKTKVVYPRVAVIVDHNRIWHARTLVAIFSLLNYGLEADVTLIKVHREDSNPKSRLWGQLRATFVSLARLPQALQK